MHHPIDYNSLKPLDASIETVATKLRFNDYLGAVKVRWGIGRNNYTVKPGLYKIGKPNSSSDLFVTANYKLSFDNVRKNLSGFNAWILAIDTKGVNVWCAAGKGTFGSSNLIKSLKAFTVASFIQHKTIIVPQLGATGISAYEVFEKTGFRVIFGPVRASDIPKFIENNYRATPAMRKVEFPLYERLKLIPVDFLQGKYKLLAILLGLFFLSGLNREGFIFNDMLRNSLNPIINIVGAYIAGIVFVPMFLPVTPFRAFALKGAVWGAVITGILFWLLPIKPVQLIPIALLNLSIASFVAMNFTGSSTFTSPSGVVKEMKIAIPLQIVVAGAGVIFFVLSKLLFTT
jgi:hypothetical protein